jgi:hypothetical protein
MIFRNVCFIVLAYKRFAHMNCGGVRAVSLSRYKKAGAGYCSPIPWKPRHYLYALLCVRAIFWYIEIILFPTNECQIFFFSGKAIISVRINRMIQI